MRKNQWISLGLVLALVLTLGVGLGTRVRAEDEDLSGQKLTVGIWDNLQEPGLRKIMDDFTEKTGVEIEIQLVAWQEYWTQLAAGASGGQLPDVFWMHSNESQRYMSNGLLLDLTDKIAESEMIDLENYPEDIVELYVYDGANYAIPKDIDTIAIWYNKTLFDEAGVEYPTADWTYEDLYEKAVALTDPEKGVYGLAEAPDNQQAGYYNPVYSAGGYIINDDKTQSGYDDPKTIEAMELWDRLIKDCMPSLEVISETGSDVLFSSGKTAMMWAGSWMIGGFLSDDYIVENCDVVELPHWGEDGRRVSIYNGLGWAAAKNTEVPEAAWKLIEYLGSEEAQLRQAELGITMSAFKDTSDAWQSVSDVWNLQAYLNMMDDMVIRPYSRNTVQWETKAIDIMKRVWQDETSMEDACHEIADEMNSVLAAE